MSDFYKKYLRSVDWEINREKALQRFDYRCVKCGTFKNIQVHHINYKNLGNEKLEDLIPVCGKHHLFLEKIKKTKGQWAMEEEINVWMDKRKYKPKSKTKKQRKADWHKKRKEKDIKDLGFVKRIHSPKQLKKCEKGLGCRVCSYNIARENYFKLKITP